jgi:hypothetical protein
LLFTPDRSILVFLDKEATAKGRLLHADLANGERVAEEMKKALHLSEDMKPYSVDAASQSGEAKELHPSHEEVE